MIKLKFLFTTAYFILLRTRSDGYCSFASVFNENNASESSFRELKNACSPPNPHSVAKCKHTLNLNLDGFVFLPTCRIKDFLNFAKYLVQKRETLNN
jgi:hypothetical protein